MAEPAFSAALDDDGTVAVPPSALGPEAVGSAWPSPILDPAVAELCVALSKADPCGPELDLAYDTVYLNFFALSGGLLPSSFFSSEDGKPFDRASIDLAR